MSAVKKSLTIGFLAMGGLSVYQWFEMEKDFKSLEVAQNSPKGIENIMTLTDIRFHSYDFGRLSHDIQAKRGIWSQKGQVTLLDNVKASMFSLKKEENIYFTHKMILDIPMGRDSLLGSQLSVQKMIFPSNVHGHIGRKAFRTSEVYVFMHKGIAQTQKKVWIEEGQNKSLFHCGEVHFTPGKGNKKREILGFYSICPGHGQYFFEREE